MKRKVLAVACLTMFGVAAGAQQGQQPPPVPPAQQAAPPSQPAQTAEQPPAPTARIIQRILVKVNGEAFTQTDLERHQLLAIRDKHPTATVATPALLDDVTPDILVDAVDELLQLQQGRELGFRMTDEKFQTYVETFKKENKIDDAQLKAGLADEGLTMETWREQWERNYIINEFKREEIGSHMQLTEEERKQYYAAHPDQFMTPATVTLREIQMLVPTQTQSGRAVFSAEIDADAKARVTAARERVLKGEDFAALAKDVSESTGTKPNGGLLGEFRLDDIDGPLRAIIDKTAVGGVTEPVRTPRGWQILKVDAKSTPQLRPFTEVQEEIFQRMYEARLDSEMSKLLVKIRAQALIQWYDNNLKQMYEKRLAEKSGK